MHGRLSNSEATDDITEDEELDAFESMEDTATEFAGHGGTATPAALIHSNPLFSSLQVCPWDPRTKNRRKIIN